MRLTVVLALAGVVWSARASAEPAARLVYLRGVGTETCADEAELRQNVHARLGYDPFSSYATSTLIAEVRADGAGFAADLKMVDGENIVRGARALSTKGACVDVTTALALAISIAIDPLLLTRTGPPPGAPPEERAVELRAPTTAEPLAEPVVAEEPDAVTTPEPERSDREYAIALGPVGSVGAAPAPTVGLALGVEAASRRVFVGLEGRADLDASRQTDAGRVSSHALTGSLLAGLRFGALHAAGVAMVGRLSAEGTEVAEPRAASALVAGAGLRIGIAVPLDRALGHDGKGWSLEARARAEMLGMFVRHRLELDGQTAYELSPVSGSGALALAVRFR